MSSSFAWLDYDPKTRREVIRMVAELGTQKGGDPMSVGVVRDALSERLFPGTSTNHTRPRYLILVPAVLSCRRIKDEAQLPKFERILTDKLVENPANVGRHGWGVIGREVRSRRITPLYWGALAKWGFFATTQTLSTSVAAAIASKPLHKRSDVRDGDLATALALSWHPGLIPLIDAVLDNGVIPQRPSIACSGEEKAFIVERLAGQIDSDGRTTALAHLAANPHQSGSWPNDLDRSLSGRKAPEHLRTQIQEALQIGLVLQGLQLAYHLALYRRSRTSPFAAWRAARPEMEEHEGRLGLKVTAWANRAQALAIDEDFADVRRWAALAQSPVTPLTGLVGASALLRVQDFDPDGRPWRDLVTKERTRHGPQSRLHFQRALERWNGAPEMVDPFGFRWAATRRLLSEVTE